MNQNTYFWFFAAKKKEHKISLPLIVKPLELKTARIQILILVLLLIGFILYLVEVENLEAIYNENVYRAFLRAEKLHNANDYFIGYELLVTLTVLAFKNELKAKKWLYAIGMIFVLLTILKMIVLFLRKLNSDLTFNLH